MLTLRDAYVDDLVAIPTGTAKLVQVGLAPEDRTGLSLLRDAMVADLIRRVGELMSGAFTVVVACEMPSFTAYNVHAAERSTQEEVARSEVVVGRVSPGKVAVTVGAVIGSAACPDPLAVRLALLQSPYASPAQLNASGLRAAERQLREWRGLVARWAEAPSKPMPVTYRDAASAAMCDDLNIPGVLELIKQMSIDAGVADGGRCETFMYLDRVLALDLTVDIGRGWKEPRSSRR